MNEKKNKSIRKSILFYLKGVIVPSLEKLILEYEKVNDRIDSFMNEKRGGEMYTLNFDELSSEYLKYEKFRNYIEQTSNQEIFILYLNLVTLLDGFKNQSPIDFMIKLSSLSLSKLEEEDKLIKCKESLYEIKINKDNSKLALDRANKLIMKLEIK